MTNTTDRNVTTFVILFIFFSITVLASFPSAAVSAETPAANSDTVLDAPDLGTLEHISEEYFSSCVNTGEEDESWAGFENNLDILNNKTFAVVKDLADSNKKIRKAVLEISRALAKINNAVINKDIRRTKKKVLKEMELLKKQLGQTGKSIGEVKQLVNESQKTVGSTYCRVDQYVNTYLARAEELEDRQRQDVAATDVNTAAKMSRKRMELYKVMQEFDHYFGQLERLFDQADHKLMLIDAVQKNIVAFVDTHCRDRAVPCTYQAVTDLRFNEVQLSDIMAKIEEAFARLVQTAKANFSGSGTTRRQEVSHAAK